MLFLCVVFVCFCMVSCVYRKVGADYCVSVFAFVSLVLIGDMLFCVFAVCLLDYFCFLCFLCIALAIMLFSKSTELCLVCL